MHCEIRLAWAPSLQRPLWTWAHCCIKNTSRNCWISFLSNIISQIWFSPILSLQCYTLKYILYIYMLLSNTISLISSLKYFTLLLISLKYYLSNILSEICVLSNIVRIVLAPMLFLHPRDPGEVVAWQHSQAACAPSMQWPLRLAATALASAAVA